MDASFLEYKFLSNSVKEYLFFLLVISLGLLLRRFFAYGFSKIVYKILKKFSGQEGSLTLVELLKKPVGFFVTVSTIYFAVQILHFPDEWNLNISWEDKIRQSFIGLIKVFLVFAFTWILLRIADYVGIVMYKKAAETESKTDDQLVPFIKEGLKIAIVIISVFFALGTVFKINIASLIAGIGIGGIAIALAAKETLENLLGSFTIFFDKPFMVGDLVDVNGVRGHVEKIGFRSTRIRTLEKSYLTVPNKKMVEGILDNISLKTLQRIKFNLVIDGETSAEQIKLLLKDYQKILNDNNELTESKIIKFYGIDERGNFVFLILYFVNTPSWDRSLEVKEELNIALIELLNKLNIKFPNLSRQI